jgi:hypothetical protein
MAKIVVERRMPFAELRQKLTGDYAHDRKEIMWFCTRHGMSEQSVRMRLKPYDYPPGAGKQLRASTPLRERRCR